MAKTKTQPQQIVPGQFYRVPGIGARPRFVAEVGPCAVGATFALNTGSGTSPNFGKLQTLDINKGLLFEATITSKYTKGLTKVLKQSPLFPANWITLLQVQFESAYSTFRLPGFLALAMQGYRSQFAPTDPRSSNFQSGASALPPKALGSLWLPTNTHVGLPVPTLAANTAGVAQTYSVFVEIPFSMYFDLYYTLNAAGLPVGMPIPRAIVSPQYMAASTRNVIPHCTFAPPLMSENNLISPVSKKSTDVLSVVATTKVACTWWRDAWIPSNTMATTPPQRSWQYTRDYIEFQPSGARTIAIPLDDDVPGQGQILSLVFMTWTPSLTTGDGNVVTYQHYTTVALVLGSSIELEQTTPASNQYRWASKHGSVLPVGFMGWDLALTPEGKLTNEFAINTLVQNGAQLRLKMKATFHLTPKATTFVGLEVLKKVGQ
ncbi:MAG: hypothetical protein ACREHG_04285 [Candidatus Saccharimonadales bacterium]